MAITRDDVLETALLARLDLAPDEIPALEADLAAVIEYVAQLAQLDTTGVEPTTHAVPLDCPLRPDEVGVSLPREQVLEMAPRVQDGFFEVPAVIDGGDGSALESGSTGATKGSHP